MPELYHQQTNFTGGEWSPKLKGRTDLPAYVNACEELTNYVPRPLGGVFPRSGTDFVARAHDPDNNVFLVPFEFSTEQAYILEFGDQYIRFYANRGRVEGTADTVTNAVDSGAGTIKLTVTGSSVTTNDYIAVRNVLGTTEANQDWLVGEATSGTVTLSGSTFTNAYTSGGTAAKIIHLTSPFVSADLFQLSYAQNKDVLYLCHRDHQTQTLTRTGAKTFTLSAFDTEFGPFKDDNTTSTTLTASATSGSITITSSSSSVPGFTSDHVASMWRIGPSVTNQIAYAKVTAVTDSTTMTVTVQNSNGLAAATTSGTTDWAEPLFSAKDGWPEAVAFFEERLVLARDQTLASSISGTPERFDKILDGETEVTDEAAWIYKLGSRQQNVIRWISPLTFMFVGTGGAEYKFAGSSEGGLTPTSVFARRQDTSGVKQMMPIEVGGDTLFVNRYGRKLMALEFSLDKDQYVATNISLLAPHLSESTSGFVQITHEENPDPIIWAVRSDGGLCSCSLLREQQVVAWAEHSTQGNFKSVMSIPGASTDEVWVAVQRTVASVDDVYIEVMNMNHMLDASIAYSGSSQTSVTGAEHLNGLEVGIVGDDANIPAATVSAGAVTIAQTSDEIRIGLTYTPTLKPFLPVRLLANGGIDGRRKRLVRAKLLLNNTSGLAINGVTIPQRSTADDVGEATPRTTGKVDVVVPMGWETSMTVTQAIPLAGEILAITQYVEVGD